MQTQLGMTIDDKLEDKFESMTTRGFEFFCQDLVGVIEKPDKSRVTPNGADGGLDVIYTTGNVVPTKKGIQAKLYSGDNKVKAGTIDKVNSALQRHNCKTGMIITTTELTPRAKGRADDHDLHHLNKKQLLTTIKKHNIGITEEGDIEEGFWAEYMQTDEDRIDSINVPQADSLEKVKTIIEVVDSGAQTRTEIQTAFEDIYEAFSTRQVDYYGVAGCILGVLDNEPYNGRNEARKWSVTSSGKKYLQLKEHAPEEAEEYFKNNIRNNRFISMVYTYVKENQPVPHSEMVVMIEQETQLGGQTKSRRVQSITQWIADTYENFVIEDPSSREKAYKIVNQAKLPSTLQ